jgi:hypothetical protein
VTRLRTNWSLIVPSVIARPGGRRHRLGEVADERAVPAVSASVSTTGMPHTADIAFYIMLAREADGPLVEPAIGNGRVALSVARATGGLLMAEGGYWRA